MRRVPALAAETLTTEAHAACSRAGRDLGATPPPADAKSRPSWHGSPLSEWFAQRRVGSSCRTRRRLLRNAGGLPGHHLPLSVLVGVDVDEAHAKTDGIAV